MSDKALEDFVREQVEVIYAMIDTTNGRISHAEDQVKDQRQQIADLRETIGGAEAEIQRLHHRIGVEEQRTSRSITDWASAGYPLLLERAEKAEAELQKTLSMLDKANVTIGRLVLGGEVVEQALTDVRAVVGETLGAKS